MSVARTKLNAQFKMRECLNSECKKRFLSTHPGHRFCETCRKRQDNGAYSEPHRVYI